MEQFQNQILDIEESGALNSLVSGLMIGAGVATSFALAKAIGKVYVWSKEKISYLVNQGVDVARNGVEAVGEGIQRGADAARDGIEVVGEGIQRGISAILPTPDDDESEQEDSNHPIHGQGHHGYGQGRHEHSQ